MANQLGCLSDSRARTTGSTIGWSIILSFYGAWQKRGRGSELDAVFDSRICRPKRAGYQQAAATRLDAGRLA